jgi:hypothetical protein
MLFNPGSLQGGFFGPVMAYGNSGIAMCIVISFGDYRVSRILCFLVNARQHFHRHHNPTLLPPEIPTIFFISH